MTIIAGYKCERVDSSIMEFEREGKAKGNGVAVGQYRRFLIIGLATYKFGFEDEAIRAFNWMTGLDTHGHDAVV